MLRLAARGFDHSEATLTCLADTALLARWTARRHAAPWVEPLRRATADLLWAPEATRVLDQPGPEAWAIFMGRAHAEPERTRRELEEAPERLNRLRQAAAIVIDLGPDWRPWEILAVERLVGRPLLSPGLDLDRRAREFVARGDPDYTHCHLIIYLSDFGNAPINEPMRGALTALCDRGCREHDRLDRPDDPGLELIWAWYCLTGEWHPTTARWRSDKIPQLADLCRQHEASLSTANLGPFYRLYHPLLLSLCILAGGAGCGSRSEASEHDADRIE